MILDYNEKTLNEVLRYTDIGQNCCVVNPCGSGKSSIMIEFIKYHLDDSFIIVTKQKNAKNYYYSLNASFRKNNVQIVTYNRMYKDFKEGNLTKYNVKYLLIDEAHYLGALNWNKAFLEIVSLYNPIVIGLTATPQRYEDQGTNNSIVTKFFDSNSVGNFSTKELERKGVFTPPKYILSLYNMKDIIDKKTERVLEADIEEDKKIALYEKLDDILLDWEKNSSPEVVIKEYLPKYMYKEKCNRILVYTSNMDDIEEKRKYINKIIRKTFPRKRIKSYVYTYKSQEKELDDFLTEDDEYIKIIYSINKIMETIHIQDLRIIFMMRKSTSNRIITQQFGRINNINNTKEPLIIDMVDNLHNLNQSSNNFRNYDTNDHHNFSADPGLNYVKKYVDIFREIDKNSFRVIDYYTYNGITGTLKELCYIFNADFNKVKLALEEQNNLGKAIESFKLPKPRKIMNIDSESNRINESYSLSDDQKIFAQKYMHLVNNFIKQRKIVNEDIIQNIYLEYFHAIIKTNDYNFNSQRVIVITTKIRRCYMDLMRKEYIRSNVLVSINNNFKDAYYTIDGYVDGVNGIILKELLLNAIKNSGLFGSSPEKERNIKALLYFFGFDGYDPHTLAETARYVNLSSARTSQIIHTGLRGLRNPSRAKKYINYYI